MDWMEEIRVRVAEADRERVLAELSAGKILSTGATGLTDARVYAHARIGTDLCIQLYWRTPALPATGSPMGQRLAAGLQVVGMVHHAVWRQVEPR